LSRGFLFGRLISRPLPAALPGAPLVKIRNSAGSTSGTCMKLSRLLPCTAILLLAGCSGPDAERVDQPVTTDLYAAAVNNPQRSAEDRERDADRKPGEVLEFLGIKPGMTVLDLFSGGGYYTELLSYVTGPEGQVVAQTNKAYEGFAGEQTRVRYADNRLANVKVLIAENNELKLSPASFDAILMALSFHDIYYVDADGGWPKLDGTKLLAELYRGARPGAVLGIIDHYAAAGSPKETGGTTHRIDPAIVIAEVEAAGFKLDGRSDLLRNLQDDYNRNVFEPELRGKTDRFVLRFRKPL
jgi:predicted methyltransferase